MTEMQRYLAEEVAEDLADGIITRREAVRRLGLLGVTGATATGLLAAVATGKAAAAGPQATTSQLSEDDSGETAWAPVPRESITFAGPRGTLMAAWAAAAKPRGGVLVIHENRGLTEHIRTVAGRLAASGYSALALDLLSEEGGTGAFPDEAAVAAALAQIPPERFVADMKASVTELRRRVSGKKLAAVGFCFGGGMVWRLLASGEPRLVAAAPFYGPFPEGGSLAGNRAAVLGVYGGLDSRINATLPAAKAALEAAGLTYELVMFTEANHAFFNDTGTRFNPHAAAEVWRRTLNWFDNAGEDD
ncbi:MAG TPA: dienelactone hydrolase family protein [Micromonosporaceae bacterium]|nr:dienelactone hydrolase family protein [Micromonosporaceae bacterium]